MPDDYAELLGSLREGTLQAEGFTHRRHVGIAIAALERYPFFQALDIVASGLQALCQRAGVAWKFNATITMASMSLIAERHARAPGLAADDVMERYPELMSSRLIEALYPRDRLHSDTARQVGLLPRAVGEIGVDARG